MNCARCGALMAPPGPYGRNCLRRIAPGVRKLAGSGHPVAKNAAAILSSGALKWAAAGLWAYRSGNVVYLVTPRTCSCPAGQHAALCKHRMAATILAS